MKKPFLILYFLLFYSLTNAQFREGFVINQYGAKYPGFLKIKYTPVIESKDQSIILLYREIENSSTEQITLKELQAFQIEEDSFLVIQDYKVPIDGVTLKGFARVLLNRKENVICTLVEYRQTNILVSQNGQRKVVKIRHYLIYRKNQFGLITDYNFYNEMPGIVAPYEELKNKIISKKLTFKDFEQICAEYEAWRKNRNH